MTIYEKGRQLPQNAPLPAGFAVYFIPHNQLQADAKKLNLLPQLTSHWEESAANRFESRRNFDFILLNIPDKSEDVEAPPIHIAIYFNPQQLIFIHDEHPVIAALQSALQGSNTSPPLPDDRVLYTFFNLLTGQDAATLEDMEEEIAKLEDEIALTTGQNYNEIISALRRRLLKYKRYYESLFDSLTDLEENQNGFFTKAQLRYVHIVTSRADRLLRSVLNLRDYVTQVREAYQAQIDISLNQTMKLFTVVTTIFLPLSLIVGWYGMNIAMPEYGWAHAYPMVIVLSALVVVGCLAYFKKKKWF